MLVGRVLRSPYAHANINKTIDTSIAKNLEGVEAVITYNYLPHIQFATYSICYSWSLDLSHRDVADRFILTYKARFVGDAVAAVIANDEIVAEKALKLIKVDYEVLPCVFTPEDAIKKDAPIIHEDKQGNIISSGIDIGNIEDEFKRADYIIEIECEYETSIVQHCQLENQTAYSF